MGDEEVEDVMQNLKEDLALNARRSMQVKCEFNSETRLIKKFTLPLQLSDLRRELQRRYNFAVDIFFTDPNREYNVPILSQDDLDLVIRIVEEHQRHRYLRLLLRESNDPDRSSPPPGTLPPGANSSPDRGSIMTASSCSEGEFIPERDIGSGSVSSRSESQQSIDSLSIGQHDSAMGSRSSIASSEQRSGDLRGGGSFPRRVPPKYDDGRLTYPRQRPRMELARSNLEQHDLIGQGAYGRVYKCRDTNTGRIYAKKVVELDANQDAATCREVIALEREIEFLQHNCHHRIVNYVDCLREPHSVSIIMEYMDCGSVRDEIKKYGPLSETLARKYARMVLEGLQFLHQCLIVHRDIKGANILKDSHGNVKLSDFGAAKKISNLQSAMSNTLVGTAHYMAPEVIRGHQFSRKADIWSMGSTVVEFLTGNPPYYQLENAACIIYRIVSDATVDYSLPASVSDVADDFIRCCFNRDVEQRLGADQLLLHSFCVDEALLPAG